MQQLIKTVRSRIWSIGIQWCQTSTSLLTRGRYCSALAASLLGVAEPLGHDHPMIARPRQVAFRPWCRSPLCFFANPKIMILMIPFCVCLWSFGVLGKGYVRSIDVSIAPGVSHKLSTLYCSHDTTPMLPNIRRARKATHMLPFVQYLHEEGVLDAALLLR
jgi:hypothetical protein